MKLKLYTIIGSILTSMSVSQLASSSALTVLCTDGHQNNEDEDIIVKVTVAADWKSALAEPKSDTPTAFHLQCNGEQSMSEEFKCDWFLNIPGFGSNSMTFFRDIKGKFTLSLEAQVIGEEPDQTILECIELK